jgi:hypothetical protein
MENTKEYIINNKTFRLNLFDELDFNSAYLIGYICGDGIYNKSTHKRQARMSVSSINEEVISWIAKNYCPDSTISKRIPVNKTRNIVSKNYSYRINMSSMFSKTFDKYGVLEIKENRRIVNISKKLFKSYLKGLIDSDGHFSSGIRRDRNRVWMNLGITHQSEQVLGYVQRFLHNELNISSFVNRRKDEDCLDLKMSNIESVIKLINWLYEENNCPFYKKYQCDKCLSLYNNKV